MKPIRGCEIGVRTSEKENISSIRTKEENCQGF